MSDFYLTCLGHFVAQGQVKSVEVKVEAISDSSEPTCKRQLMRFRGMAGYHRNSAIISQRYFAYFL